MGRGRKNLEEDRGRSAIPRTRTITLEGRGGGGGGADGMTVAHWQKGIKLHGAYPESGDSRRFDGTQLLLPARHSVWSSTCFNSNNKIFSFIFIYIFKYNYIFLCAFKVQRTNRALASACQNVLLLSLLESLSIWYFGV